MKLAFRILLALTLTLFLFACDDDDDSTNNVNNVNNTTSTNNVNNTNVWDAMVTITVDGSEIPVNLMDIDRADWNGVEAIRLTRVIEQAVLELPWNYHYNFIGNDGYNVLVEKLDEDLARLPYYGELDSGFLYESDGGLRIGWEDSLGFPGSLGVRGMDGGVIELHTFDTARFLVTADGSRLMVDVSAFDTVDATDWKNPEDGLIPMVPMTSIFDDLALTDPSGLVFKIYGNDGFSNNDTNLMPYENMTHAYIEPTEKKLIIEEDWDTLECCWRVRDIVVFKGIRE